MFASAVVLLVLGSGLTFYQDTWNFLLNRRGFSADVFLAPHNEHIVVAPVAIQKLLLEAFGMESALGERLVLIAVLLITVAFLFTYLRRRIGDWPAFFASALILFLGPAWQVLLWPFEYSLAGGVAGGLAMLVMLDRQDRRGDILACLALIVSFSFATLGLAFAAAALVDVWLHRRERGWGRLYVALVPLALYGAWYLGYGHEAGSPLALRNVAAAPQYILDALAASTAALFGLGRPMPNWGTVSLNWGRPLLVLAIAVAVASQYRRPGISRRVTAGAVAGAAYFAMAALSYSVGREPTNSRYLHMSAIFTLLIAVALFERHRFRPRALVIAGLITAVAVLSNMVPLVDGRSYMMRQTELTRSNLAAMELARDHIPPHFRLAPDIAGTGSLIDVQAQTYFSAADKYGTPAYSEAELREAPDYARYQADVVLIDALPVSDGTSLGLPEPGSLPGVCQTVEPGSNGELSVDPGVVNIAVGQGQPYAVQLRRFAEPGDYALDIQGIAPESVTRLEIPQDRGTKNWSLRVLSAQGAEVCES